MGRESRANKKRHGKGMPKKWLAPVVAGVIALLVVAAIVLSILDANSVFLRHKIVMSSEHFEVTATMFECEYHDAWDYLYEQGVEEYEDKWDYTAYLSVVYSADMYAEAYAQQHLSDVLKFCEAGYDAGLVMEEEDYAAVDETMAIYEEQGNKYYRENYGVNLKDLRALEELIQFASKFEGELEENILSEVITYEVIDEFAQENKYDYLQADYYRVHPYTVYAEDTETYEEDCAAAKAVCDQLAACTSVDEFVALYEQFCEEGKCAGSDEDNGLHYDEVRETLESRNSDSAINVFDWMFGSTDDTVAPASAGTTLVTELTGTTSYTPYVYYIVKSASRNMSRPKDFAFMVVPTEKFDETAQNTFLESFESGEKTSQAFYNLASQLENCYCKMAQQQYGIDEVDYIAHWFASDDVTEGTLMTTTTYVDDTECVLIIFVEKVYEDGDPEWYNDAVVAYIDEYKDIWLNSDDLRADVNINDDYFEDYVPLTGSNVE